MHNITPTLHSLAVPIESLHQNPINTRKHEVKSLDALALSLEKYGQRKPIVVQAQGNIVRAGNGLLAAAMSLNWSHIAAVVIDESNTDAVAYEIMDNKSAELSVWETEALTMQLASLKEDAVDIALTGFCNAELDLLLCNSQAGKTDPLAEWQGMPAFNQPNTEGVQAILVHFATHEDVAKFATLVEQNLTEKTKSIWYPRVPDLVNIDKEYRA